MTKRAKAGPKQEKSVDGLKCGGCESTQANYREGIDGPLCDECFSKITTAPAPASDPVKPEDPQADEAESKRGRPAMDPDEVQSEIMHIRVPKGVYDAYARHSLRVGVSLSASVRDTLVRNAPRHPHA